MTVWGVILPVGLLSIIGWFWFSKETFDAAWNPQGLSIGQGMGSSISLTLWAFLGMESAAQNSDAVENPKKNVPLACLFGTLGAAVIYVLSTTVIQGIVPNAELAESTGPFGLVYAKMFGPTVGTIVMALAVLACLGSLLGWQFTIASTGKSAAESRMMPALFAKVNSMGAPIKGMIVLGIVQTALALSTISPTLSEQFSALVNLAVVTNVIPYIVSLSALVRHDEDRKGGRQRLHAQRGDRRPGHGLQRLRALRLGQRRGDGRHAGARRRLHRLGIHREPLHGAAGRQPRARGEGLRRTIMRIKSSAMFAAAAVALACAMPAAAQTLDRIKETAFIKLGYLDDARPFSFAGSAGKPDGYTIEVCQRIVEELKKELALPQLAVDSSRRWPSTGACSRIDSARIDLLCSPTQCHAGQSQGSVVLDAGVRAEVFARS